MNNENGVNGMMGKYKDILNEANNNINALKIKLADMYLKNDVTQNELINQINALRSILSDAFNIVGLENPSIEEFKLKLTKLVNENKVHVAEEVKSAKVPPCANHAALSDKIEKEITAAKNKIEANAEGKKKAKTKK